MRGKGGGGVGRQVREILFPIGSPGEVDGSALGINFWDMSLWLIAGFLVTVSGCLAQSEASSSAAAMADLPSAEPAKKLPGVGEDSPAPDLSKMAPAESPSVPQLRPPSADPAKKKAEADSDWAAQAMLQKKEEAKKRQEQESAALEQKAREEQQAQAKLAEEKKAKSSGATPAVAGAAVPGFGSADAQKLPAVTGLDGVKPRGTPSGDGRVQPAFDSFSGPSSTGPLGKDYQAGAKPIMPGTSATDGRMQVAPKAPEAPSASYKRISQDPYTVPPGYGEKKSVPPPQPKVETKNPPPGNPLTPGSPAGLSPYDNTKKVPDPRSQRRF